MARIVVGTTHRNAGCRRAKDAIVTSSRMRMRHCDRAEVSPLVGGATVAGWPVSSMKENPCGY
jgi:hypothetical protein